MHRFFYNNRTCGKKFDAQGKMGNGKKIDTQGKICNWDRWEYFHGSLYIYSYCTLTVHIQIITDPLQGGDESGNSAAHLFYRWG